jgi:hypothetical protein
MMDVAGKTATPQTLMINAISPLFFLQPPQYRTSSYMRPTQKSIDPNQGDSTVAIHPDPLQNVLSLNIAWTGLRLRGATKSIDASMEPLESNGA